MLYDRALACPWRFLRSELAVTGLHLARGQSPDGRCFAMKGTGLERVGWIGKLETFGPVLQVVGCLLLVTSWGSDKNVWARS